MSRDDEELLSVRVAELYYDENKTQDEVGALLKISRWKVGRLLTQARERGIVRIEIVHPRARRLKAHGLAPTPAFIAAAQDLDVLAGFAFVSGAGGHGTQPCSVGKHDYVWLVRIRMRWNGVPVG